MRRHCLFSLLSATLAIFLAGCGAMGSNHFTVTSASLTGNWSATTTTMMSSVTGSMPSPVLSFTFTMTEGPTTMAPGMSPTASVSVSNLNFTMGSNCFDNMAVATATAVGTAGSNRTLILQLSEDGNMAMFSMAVPPNDSSALGNFALTGGHMLSADTTPCMPTFSGAASFSHL